MERTEVKSSQIKSIGFDQEKSILEIEFHATAWPASVYQYSDVPVEIYNGLMEAQSIGRYFGQQVRGKFKFVKLLPPEKTEGAKPDAAATL